MRKALIRPIISIIFILLASFVLSDFMVEYKYLKFDEYQEFYLDDSPRVIDLKIRNGTIIEVSTQKLSGDVDVYIELRITHNESYIEIVNSTALASSEYITYKVLTDAPITRNLFLNANPSASIYVIPGSGSGMISLRYRVLQPAHEITNICIFVVIIGISFLTKDVREMRGLLNKGKKPKRR